MNVSLRPHVPFSTSQKRRCAVSEHYAQTKPPRSVHCRHAGPLATPVSHSDTPRQWDSTSNCASVRQHQLPGSTLSTSEPSFFSQGGSRGSAPSFQRCSSRWRRSTWVYTSSRCRKISAKAMLRCLPSVLSSPTRIVLPWRTSSSMSCSACCSTFL